MYDKDEINALAVLYTVEPFEEHFELLLKALEPMIEKVILRYPEVQEHLEDIRQEVFLKLLDLGPRYLWLGVIFNGNIPADYFFFRIRDWARREAEKIKKKYDMYNPVVKSIEDLTKREKKKLRIEITREDYDEWT